MKKKELSKEEQDACKVIIKTAKTQIVMMTGYKKYTMLGFTLFKVCMITHITSPIAITPRYSPSSRKSLFRHPTTTLPPKTHL